MSHLLEESFLFYFFQEPSSCDGKHFEASIPMSAELDSRRTTTSFFAAATRIIGGWTMVLRMSFMSAPKRAAKASGRGWPRCLRIAPPLSDGQVRTSKSSCRRVLRDITDIPCELRKRVEAATVVASPSPRYALPTAYGPSSQLITARCNRCSLSTQRDQRLDHMRC